MIVLDASVLIAVLDGKDVHFAAAAEVFRSRQAERLIAHRLTLAETLVRASRTGEAMAAAQALAAFGVETRDALDDPIELADLRSRTGLKMPDCCVLDSALRERATLATFDARLASAARDVGVLVVGA